MSAARRRGRYVSRASGRSNRSVQMPERVRPERVGQEIQAAVADLLLRGLIRDPRGGFITVTGVKVTPDLRSARVFWSMLGTAEQKKDCAAGLEKARGLVRREGTARGELRVSPEV